MGGANPPPPHPLLHGPTGLYRITIQHNDHIRPSDSCFVIDISTSVEYGWTWVREVYLTSIRSLIKTIDVYKTSDIDDNDLHESFKRLSCLRFMNKLSFLLIYALDLSY